MKKKIKDCYGKLHNKSNREMFQELIAREFGRDLHTTVSDRWLARDFSIPKKYQPRVLKLLKRFHEIQKECDLKMERLLKTS